MAAKAKSISKTDFVKAITEASGLNKKDVVKVLDELNNLVAKNVGKKGPGIIQLPGLVKILVVTKPAQPAKKGVKNPFTGEIRDVPAKPAKKVIRVRPLKALKDLAK